MLGSSKSLIRALDTVFNNWDPNFRGDLPVSPDVTLLYTVIDAYKEKHNSIATTSASLSDSLRLCYNSYVKNANDLSRDLFFVVILTKLLPVLASEDVKVWLHTYLRPALNSAGMDLKFVELSRNFILALTENAMDSEDSELVKKRQVTSEMVMDHVLRAFIGKDPKIYPLLDMKGLDYASGTHEDAERLRFVKRNASLLLQKSASKRPKEFFTVLDKHFTIAAQRHSCLVLLSQVSSKSDLPAINIAETPLLANLLRSLLHDFSEAVITSGLYVLVMLVAKLKSQLSSYVSDLFTIVSRLTGWSEFSKFLEIREKHLLDYLTTHKIEWDRAAVDSELTVMQPQFFVDGEFNLSYLLTMLYGMFPRHLIEFSKSPTNYWNQHPPRLIKLEHIKTLETTSFPAGFSDYVSQKLRDQCRRFMVHPNLLLSVSMEHELANPTAWVQESENAAEEEILLACYELNPDILLTLLDNMVVSKTVDRFSGRKSISSERLFYSGRGSLLNGFGQPNSTRSSLTLGDIDNYMKLSVPSHWERLDRRLSIVPTKLVIDNKTAPDSPGSGVKFKSVNFGSFDDLLESGTLDEKSAPEQRKKGSVSELYAAHERLFTPNGHSHNQDMKDSPMAKGSIQTATKTASEALGEQLKVESDGKSGIGSPKLVPLDGPTESSGSALDFYQRELLLMKNEMEFMSYMKHLSRYNYMKLKMKLNKNLQDNNVNKILEDRKESKDDGKEVNVDMQYEDLLAATRNAEIDNAASIELKLKQNEILSERVAVLRSRVAELEATIEKLEYKLGDCEAALAESKETEASVFEELQISKNELRVLQRDYEILASKKSAPAILQPERASSPSLDQHEKEIFDLKTQISIVKDENLRLLHELEQANEQLEFTTKSHEKQLATIKLDRGQAVREMTSHYEQKIQELSVAIAKFEVTLDERHARILQLSTSKPIRIPDSMEMRPTAPRGMSAEVGGPDLLPSMHDYFAQRGNSSFYAESTSLSSPSLQPQRPSIPQTPSSRQSSTQNMPILRGRGGYQKRSKKM